MHSFWLGLYLLRPCTRRGDARRLQSCFERVTPALLRPCDLGSPGREDCHPEAAPGLP